MSTPTNDSDLVSTIPTETLADVNGGWSREDSQNLGGQAAEVGVLGAGAFGGTWAGGRGGAAVGTIAAEALNRTGYPNRAGRAAGGAVDDGVRAVGRRVNEMSEGLQLLYGKK